MNSILFSPDNRQIFTSGGERIDLFNVLGERKFTIGEYCWEGGRTGCGFFGDGPDGVFPVMLRGKGQRQRIVFFFFFFWGGGWRKLRGWRWLKLPEVAKRISMEGLLNAF